MPLPLLQSNFIIIINYCYHYYYYLNLDNGEEPGEGVAAAEAWASHAWHFGQPNSDHVRSTDRAAEVRDTAAGATVPRGRGQRDRCKNLSVREYISLSSYVIDFIVLLVYFEYWVNWIIRIGVSLLC